jgi:imidazolonepropionase-like amidohydrolase
MGLLLKNCIVLNPAKEERLEGKDLYLYEGKIKLLGEDISANDLSDDNLKTIDLSGHFVMPGLMDAHSHCGIHELDLGIEGNDTNETFSSINSHIRALDGFYYYDSAVMDALRSGVTTLCIAPGSLNVIGGQMAVIRTNGDIVDKNLLSSYCGLKAALGENTKRSRSIPQRATTRMGSAALLRETFYKAKDYENRRKKSDSVEFNLKYESLLRVLNREVPLRLHAHRADDIATGIRIAKEFNIKLVIEHATSAHLIADYLKENGVDVVAGPYLSTRTKPELVDRGWKNLPVLFEAGLKVALTVDHPVIPIDSLWVNALLAYKSGVSYWDTLKSVTSNPAEICGVEKNIGRVEKGYIADLTVWSADPIKFESKLLWVIQNGEIAFQA